MKKFLTIVGLLVFLLTSTVSASLYEADVDNGTPSIEHAQLASLDVIDIDATNNEFYFEAGKQSITIIHTPALHSEFKIPGTPEVVRFRWVIHNENLTIDVSKIIDIYDTSRPLTLFSRQMRFYPPLC